MHMKSRDKDDFSGTNELVESGHMRTKKWTQQKLAAQGSSQYLDRARGQMQRLGTFHDDETRSIRSHLLRKGCARLAERSRQP